MPGPNFDNRRRGPGNEPTKELNVAQLFNLCNQYEKELKDAKRRILALERAGNGYSYVRAASSVSQLIPTTVFTPVVFEIENEDLLGEYDETTGTFTAKYRGHYMVAWRVLSDSVAWALGNVWLASLVRTRNGLNNVWSGYVWEAQAAITDQGDTVGVAFPDLDRGDYLNVGVYHTNAAGVNTWNNGAYVYFHVARVS